MNEEHQIQVNGGGGGGDSLTGEIFWKGGVFLHQRVKIS